MKYPTVAGIIIVIIIIFTIATKLFYVRRKLHPLPGRYPMSSLLNAGLTICSLVVQATTILWEDSCYLEMIVYTWFLPMTMFSVVLRSWLLLGQYAIASHIKQYQQHITAVTTPLPWFIRHRNWVRPLNIFKFTVGFSCVTLIWWTVMSGALYPEAFYTRCINRGDPITNNQYFILTFGPLVTVLYIFLALFILGIVAYRLSRQTSDAFGILTELRWIGLGCLLLVVMYLPAFAIVINELYGETLILLAQVVIFVPTIMFPIRLSYQFQVIQRQQVNDLQRVKTVEELLALPQGYELFVAYCQTEFCSEGLNLWKRVTSFKANCNRSNMTNDDYQSIITDAHDILDTFIMNGAPLEVNISYELRQATRRVLLEREASLQSWMTANPRAITPPPGHAHGHGDDTVPLLSATSSSSNDTPKGGHGAAYLVRTTPTPTHGSAARSTPKCRTTSHRSQRSEDMTTGVTEDGGIIIPIIASTPTHTHVATTTTIGGSSSLSPVRLFGTVFDEVLSICVSLLQAGPFTRFTTSSIFRSFVEGLQHGSNDEAMSHVTAAVGASLQRLKESSHDAVSRLLTVESMANGGHGHVSIGGGGGGGSGVASKLGASTLAPSTLPPRVLVSPPPPPMVGSSPLRSSTLTMTESSTRMNTPPLMASSLATNGSNATHTTMRSTPSPLMNQSPLLVHQAPLAVTLSVGGSPLPHQPSLPGTIE